jgi:1-deoxy-D-xylulose-5-phosphate synthase
MAVQGVNVAVADARFAKPLDTDLLAHLATNYRKLVIVEENSPGGFSAHVMTYLANHGLLDTGVQVRLMTLPDIYIEHDSQAGQLALAGIDAAGIERMLTSLSSASASGKASTL